MLYYGFWELSLVPMAILIAMYGRKDGPKAATKFFLFTFIPSAPLLVAILWLYAKTGTFQLRRSAGMISRPARCRRGALFWAALAFLFAFAVKVPVFPLHGWLADTFSEAPVALAMVVAGKLGLYSMLRFHVGLFPAQAQASCAIADCAGRDRHPLRRLPGAGAARLLAADRLCRAEPFEPDRAGHLRAYVYGLRRARSTRF